MRIPNRTKLALWLVAGMFGPALTVLVLTLLNVNKLDPKLGEDNYVATYAVDGRYAKAPDGGEFSEILLDTSGASENGRTLKITSFGNENETPLAEDGTVGDETYSIFWVHLANPISDVGTQKTGWVANVRDEPGLLGKPGKVYVAKSLSRFIYWDYIISSQASYHVGIYDGDERVATAIYDMTCGMLFNLEPNVGGWGRVYLLKTDFPISRNRYHMLYSGTVFSLLILGWFLFQLAKSAPDKKYKAIDNLWFAIAIVCTVLVDYIYDTWFFSNGDGVTIALHVGVILLLMLRFKGWVIPLILEMVWIISYTIATTGHLAPGIVYFPSMLATVSLMLAFRRTPKPKNA